MITDAPPPDWLDELNLEPGPPWAAMRVRSLDLDDWLIADETRDLELATKRELLDRDHDSVFRAEEGSEAAGREVLAMIRSWLGAHRDVGEDHAIGGQGLHPLDVAGRLVQEDLCVMVEHGGAYRLDAASVCFPSHWRLDEKFGLPLAEIHAPVPHYADELSSKVDTFFTRLAPDRPVVRRNFSIHDHDELHRPEPTETFDTYTGGIEGLWLRSERQTLVRLPDSGAVLFTIKTQQCRVAAVAARPEIARAMATTLRALGTELARLERPVHFPAWLPDRLDALAR